MLFRCTVNFAYVLSFKSNGSFLFRVNICVPNDEYFETTPVVNIL
jgi:hypothetical protein